MAFPLFHPEDGRAPPLFLTPNEFASEFPVESDVLEWKQGLGPGSLQEVVVAFSNSRGGVVLFGVTDEQTIVGMPLTQGLHDKLHHAVGAVRNPGRYAVRSLKVGEREVTVLAVERRVEGFAQTSNGRVLARVGPRNVALFDSELTRFVRERSFQRFDSTDAKVATSEVGLDRIAALAHAYGWTDPGAYGVRLVERGLALDNGNLTVAGALVLLSRPSDLLGKAYVEILRYADEETEDYDRRVAVHGPVGDQVEQVARLIEEELGTEMVVMGLERHELPRLPLVVIREAIANAVAHRSYEMSGTPVRVEIRPRGVRVISPGSLPPPVTVENMREANAARNVAVVDALRGLKLAEDAGRGVAVMQDTMRAEMLEPPQFSDHGHEVEVFLPTHGPVTARERAWVREIERRGDIDPGDRILLVHAARGAVLTNQAVRKLAGLDRIEAMRALQRLRDAGFLIQEGERGGSSYRLDGSLSPPAGLRLSGAELRDVVIGLATEGPVTNGLVRARTGLDRAATLRVLDELVRQGRLRRVGERRGTRYVIQPPIQAG
jgi:ATP-dependent DNA helicase RecG